ncbi:MAG: single-stranded DNA-binding protein [Candidatus Roseilinea sp.]|uniref:single-stranded DNA-binding protein n=1 Tax=Candidatus Roseilinea sp. TaxID=2838777 RepID=UPI0040493FBF
MYQNLILVGRLGRDPEMRYMPNGDPVTSFSMATDRAYTSKDGQLVKETTWWRVSVFGKQAETVNQYLSKGKMVLVEGRLRADPKTGGPQTYTRQDGTVGASFEVVANTIRFLSPKSEGDGPAEGEVSVEGAGGHDENIPF